MAREPEPVLETVDLTPVAAPPEPPPQASSAPSPKPAVAPPREAPCGDRRRPRRVERAGRRPPSRISSTVASSELDGVGVDEALGRRALLVSVAAIASAVCRPASATDPATATMLFNEARRLVAAGRYAEACPKFEESQRLDPGIGTQFNLADCYEHTSRIASAWALFLDVASSAGGTGQLARERVARKRASSARAELSEADDRGAEERHRPRGAPQRRAARRRPLEQPDPRRPGELHDRGDGARQEEVVDRRHGGPERRDRHRGHPGARERRVRPPGAADQAHLSADSTPSQPAAADRSRTERTIAIGLGGAGVVGVGIGSFFGLRSIAKHSDYERLCTAGVCAPAAGPIHDDAVAAGNASTVAFVLGGALIAGGAVLWFIAPRPSSTARLGIAPSIGSSGAGAIVAGGW